MAEPGLSPAAALNPLNLSSAGCQPAGLVGRCFVPQRALDSWDSLKVRDAKG